MSVTITLEDGERVLEAARLISGPSGSVDSRPVANGLTSDL
jgi:hypothetical protein